MLSCSVSSRMSVCEAASLVAAFTRSTTSVRCTNVSPSIPGWGDTQSDDVGDDLSPSIGEFLGEENEEALETLEIEDVDDLPPGLNLEDREDLSSRDSVSLV